MLTTTAPKNFLLSAEAPVVVKQLVESLVIIDSAIDQYHLLAEAVESTAAVILLDEAQDGVRQILKALDQFSAATVIHLIAHGAPGYLTLGNVQLNSSSLDCYGWDLLTASAERDLTLCLYACNVAAGDAGAKFVQKLQHLTGGKIAAATTPVGNAAQGGDWNLTYRIGKFEFSLPIAQAALAAYPGLLNVHP